MTEISGQALAKIQQTLTGISKDINSLTPVEKRYLKMILLTLVNSYVSNDKEAKDHLIAYIEEEIG